MSRHDLERIFSAIYVGSLLILSLSNGRLWGFVFLSIGSVVALAVLLFFRSPFFTLLFLIVNLFIIPPQFIAAARDSSLESVMSVEDDLKQIVRAMKDYHNIHDRFPAHAVIGPGGEALTSWRVELLPFLGQGALYKKFRLDEPWDSPDNLKLLPLMPKIFRAKCHEFPEQDFHTHYQVFVGPNAAFEDTSGLSLKGDFPDDTRGTILVVEAFVPVPWTKPVDIPFGSDKILPHLGEPGPSRSTHWWYRESRAAPPPRFFVGMADGSTQSFANPVNRAFLRRWITRNGGEIIFGD